MYEFDEYGRRISPANTGGVESQKTFVGGMSVQDEVADTGLMMMGHRFYAPDHGRFLNRDPIGFAGGLNLFEYAGSSPMSYIDALGMKPYSIYSPGASNPARKHLVKVGKEVIGPQNWNVYIGFSQDLNQNQLLNGTSAGTSILNGKLVTYIALPSNFASLSGESQYLFLKYSMKLEADQASWWLKQKAAGNCPDRGAPTFSMYELYEQEISAHLKTIGSFAKTTTPEQLQAAFGSSKGAGKFQSDLLKVYQSGYPKYDLQSGPEGAIEAFQMMLPFEKFLRMHGIEP